MYIHTYINLVTLMIALINLYVSGIYMLQARLAAPMFYWPPAGPRYFSMEGQDRLLKGFDDRLSEIDNDDDRVKP